MVEQETRSRGIKRLGWTEMTAFPALINIPIPFSCRHVETCDQGCYRH